MSRNNWKSIICALILAGALGLTVSPALADPYGAQKVVYHFNTNNLQVNKAGLKNIQNHINAVGKDQLTVVALVHSAAWELVARDKANSELTETMKFLIAQGVVFKMCNNTLREHRLDAAKDLVVPMILVPAGVAELVRLQQMGYAYIKP